MFKILNLVGLVCLQFNSFSIQPEFTAAYNSRKKAVIVRWQHQQAGIQTYVVQRSTDNKIWTDIALQQVDGNTKTRPFYFEDKKPAVGENHYRLKCIYPDGRSAYSLNVMVIIGSLLNSWVIYPVPVVDLLTLEYRGTESVKGVINIFIQQSSGRILTRLRYSSLNTLIKIPVNNLGKGMYDIRIIVQDEIVWNQRFIK
jgi:hypothetical protein